MRRIGVRPQHTFELVDATRFGHQGHGLAIKGHDGGAGTPFAIPDIPAHGIALAVLTFQDQPGVQGNRGLSLNV